MSVFFHSQDGRVVRARARTFSRAFVEVTKAACNFYGFEAALSEIEADECHIHDDVFCALVEAAFNRPDESFYGWARQAADIYETIKGEQYYWVWDEIHLPIELLHVQRQKGFVPEKVDTRVIGRMNTSQQT